MSEQEYFKKALSDFAFDMASGGAIRHMADQGYSVKQIMERLDFPTSYEKVQRTVWEHLQHTGVLLLEEPGNGKSFENTAFVKEYDKYGKPSFRRVILSNQANAVNWKEEQFQEATDGKLISFLEEKWKQNKEGLSYVSCDFALRKREESAFMRLDRYQKDYILGISCGKNIFYHKINRSIMQIIVRLYEMGEYEGICYFMRLGEKIGIAKKKIISAEK